MKGLVAGIQILCFDLLLLWVFMYALLAFRCLFIDTNEDLTCYLLASLQAWVTEDCGNGIYPRCGVSLISGTLANRLWNKQQKSEWKSCVPGALPPANKPTVTETQQLIGCSHK